MKPLWEKYPPSTLISEIEKFSIITLECMYHLKILVGSLKIIILCLYEWTKITFFEKNMQVSLK